MEFRGLFTALVTPFREDGELDEEGFRKNIDFQISEGIDGIVPVGTTGESATLTGEEHKKVVEIAIDQAKGKVPVGRTLAASQPAAPRERPAPNRRAVAASTPRAPSAPPLAAKQPIKVETPTHSWDCT